MTVESSTLRGTSPKRRLSSYPRREGNECRFSEWFVLEVPLCQEDITEVDEALTKGMA